MKGFMATVTEWGFVYFEVRDGVFQFSVSML